MVCALALAAALACGGDESLVDPVNLLLWREAVDLLDRHEAEIWPGFRLAGIPALITHPNVGEILLRHPRPPAGFHLLDAELRPEALRDEPTWIRRGTTAFTFVNGTTTSIGGAATLVVPDRALMHSDTWSLGAIVHEGFHVWSATQMKIAAPASIGLADFPNLDPEVNARLELEGRALVRAARAAAADDPLEMKTQATVFLAERRRRRERMPSDAIAWEDGTELCEGLAKFVELRALQLWSRVGVSETLVEKLPDLERKEGFARDVRSSLAHLRDYSRGTLGYEGSPYGPATVRVRGYFFGAALGLVLERVAGDWKARVAKGALLTHLLREAVGQPSDAELARVADDVEGAADFATLVAAKRDLATEAADEGERRIAAVLEGGGTCVVIDASELAGGGAFRITAGSPFGVLRVDDHRLLYSNDPTTFTIGSARVETPARPGVIVDPRAHTLTTRVARPPDLFQTFAWFSRRPFIDSGLTIDSPRLATKREGEATVRITLQDAK
jgi:hypothetical protein